MENAEYVLYDFNSDIVDSGSFVGHTELDVSCHKKGKYILKIITKKGGKQTKQIIIE